ncbi:hypothetical protein M408DRAFT_14832 [Serendipita vermifera MAFF 305830]|uniref:Armadillo repeat-containing protein 8 n=1 Tax=Serendipita vermifera MAFF 305830 TaxID=933852 RepID=A0A0C3BJK2_SERVB|nr:hypothetical protein M408DRAFT_14832 [Serendipita vermifera MAFF 305830]
MDNQDHLRILKNKIIGNLDAKDSLARDAPSILQCLSLEYTSSTRIEAANVLYSLSSGSQSTLAQLVKHNALTSLLTSLSQLDAQSSPRLKAALGRAVRTLVCSLADLIGPQRWGILPTVPAHLRQSAHVALDDFLQPPALDIWLPLLQDATLYPFLCATIANGIRTHTHRTALCEWLPPAERAKANKGKRGWEKRAASITSPAPSSAPFSPVPHAPSWVLHELLRGSTSQGATSPKVAASLEALAALCKDNPAACSFLKSDTGPNGEGGYMQSLLLLQRSSNPEVRIAINELLANIVKTTLGPSFLTSGGAHHHRPSGVLTTHPAFSICLTILHNLLTDVGSDIENEPMRTKACFIVSSLAVDDRDIAEAAVDCGAIPAALTAIEWTAKPRRATPNIPIDGDITMDIDTDPEEEESQVELELREAAFTLLATISLTNTEFTRQIVKRDAVPEKPIVSSLIAPPPSTNPDNQRPHLFPLISQSIAHPNLGVRFSALQLARAFSRALGTLRTTFVDSDVPRAVIDIITKDDPTSKRDDLKPTTESEESSEAEHRGVIVTALMVLCNLLNDYASFREKMLKEDLVKQLVRKTHSLDDEIRLNAMWALKSAAFNAKHDEVTLIMGALTWDHFEDLTNDPDWRVREQAITLLRNITVSAQEITFTVNGLGLERLNNILLAAMSRSDSETVENSIRALNNIITESTHDALGTNKPLLTLLKTHLSHSSVAVRHAAASCLCELLARYPFRHRELREIGIEQALRAVLGGRDRVGHGHPHTPTMVTGSGFGAALGNVGPFGAGVAGGAGSSTLSSGRFPGLGMVDTPGLMGRESDREVLDAVKLALALLEKGKE